LLLADRQYRILIYYGKSLRGGDILVYALELELKNVRFEKCDNEWKCNDFKCVRKL